MNRAFEWISLSLSLLALVFSAAGASYAGLAFACAITALIFGVIEILIEPRRALLLLTYLPSFAVAAAVYTFDGHGAGLIAFAAAVVGLQGRLAIFRVARRLRDQALLFAKELKNSLPEKVFVFIDMDIEGEVPSSTLHEGHLIRVRPQDTLPADGQVTFGSSFVDESPLNGEKEPRTKGMGSYVYAGTVNKNGSLLYRAAGAPATSQAMRLSRAMEKSFPFESIFSPALIFGELLIGAAALLFFLADWGSLSTLLNILLASGGAGMAAAIATRDRATILRTAAEGAAWRDKEAIGRAGLASTVVSTAAGVITEGRYRLTEVVGTEFTGEDGALRLLAPLARRLENEIAFTILRELTSRNIPLEPVEAFSVTPGGATGLVTGEEVRWIDVETARLEGVPMAKLDAFARERGAAGESVVLLLRENRAAAALSFSDRVQDSSSAGLGLLRRLGLNYILVSGEAEATLRPLREELGLSHVQSDAGPREIENLLGQLEKESLHPLWVAAPGAPSLSHRGATFAAVGSHQAEAAEAALLRPDLINVARLLRIAKIHRAQTKNAVRFNAVAQIILIGLGLVWDPRLAVLAGLLPGYFLVVQARALREMRL
ncbi:MAG: cation-translocating P-type ATPase [Proteobacteria bacterium]|nr:MAG: cation-translocating P-type ATPase [Pseudomonadota bacterium]